MARCRLGGGGGGGFSNHGHRQGGGHATGDKLFFPATGNSTGSGEHISALREG